MGTPMTRSSFVGPRGESGKNWPANSLRKVSEQSERIPYKDHPLAKGRFYGPKIDIKLVDAIGRLWQLFHHSNSNFNLAERFAWNMWAEDGIAAKAAFDGPHRALFGSVERFFRNPD